jgi:hypothetical protein
MCQNLGLNRNCDSWNLSDAEKEERKRVFYCSFVVDRLSCAMHGRAPMIDERDYDTPYPSEIDDDDKGNSPTIMDNFHQLIKLCEILGDILGQLYMIKGRKQISMMASPDRVISKLDKALNRWMANLPPNVQYKPPNIRLGEKAPVPNLELCQIYMLFYTSLILLHRPFIPGPSQEGTPSVFPSASICTFAANKILDIVESLMAEGRLTKINNYTLYFMFTAGIIFINDALSSDSMFAFEAKISINKIIHAMDEVEKTWITSARHCNILAELAGLRDINLDNIDEHPSSKSTSYSQSLSIAVPNSPALETQNPIELRNPIDAQKSTNQILPAYITQSTSPSVYNQTGYSTPVFPDDLMQDQPFDPIGTAFWGMPMSFDIDEWNSYLSNQNPRQDLSQVQRQDILPNNSNNNMW